MPRPPADPESFLPLPPADLQLLLILSDKPLHAYGISRAVDERETRVRLEIGSLYRMLTRMEHQGLIEERDEQDREQSESRRRYYGITKLGRRVAAAEVRRLQAVIGLAEEKKLVRPRRATT